MLYCFKRNILCLNISKHYAIIYAPLVYVVCRLYNLSMKDQSFKKSGQKKIKNRNSPEITHLTKNRPLLEMKAKYPKNKLDPCDLQTKPECSRSVQIHKRKINKRTRF